MNDACSVIRLIHLVIFHDERNGTVTIQPRTPCETRPPRQMTAEALEQILLPLVDARAAADALKEQS